MATVGYSPSAFHVLNVAFHILNMSLVFAIGRRLSLTVPGAGCAALFFAVLPGIADAVVWVSAMTALLMTTGCLTAVLTHIIWLNTQRRWARAASIVAFAAALLSHEGAVMLLPLLILADVMRDDKTRRAGRSLWMRYAPFAVLLMVYLSIAFVVNRANYLVTSGGYRIGLHAVGNLLQYVSALYVGRKGVFAALTTIVALILLSRVTSVAVRFGLAWMVLALVPYSFFTWTGAGRYAYLASAGFSLLLAGVVQRLAEVLKMRTGRTAGAIVATVVAIAIAGRFAAFASRNVDHLIGAGEPYREWFAAFQRTHGALPRGAAVTIEDPKRLGIDTPALPALLRLEYGDPTLQIQVVASP